NAEQATPPAFTAWAGPKRMPFSKNASIASLVQGILAPSATTFTLLLINFSAASLSISFCVTQGSAISQGTDQIFEQSSKYSASGCVFIYSLLRLPSENLIRLIVCRLRPLRSELSPLESLHATTFAPSLMALSIA